MSEELLLDKLTVKQRAFAEAYTSNGGNATRAYYQAGFVARSESVASTESSNFLRKPEIQNYIRHLQANVSKRFDISADRLVQELAAIAFADPKQMFNDDGELLPISEIPDHCLGALAEINVETVTDRRGNVTIKRKGKLADRQRALEGLMKVTGLSSELNLALNTLSKYGVHLKQDSATGEWRVENG
ncbi:terminase small subunit [Leptolyngbya sp. FACHB-17]|nr:terminase small subunit [Leptolyngbya sp. FACHB-17]